MTIRVVFLPVLLTFFKPTSAQTPTHISGSVVRTTADTLNLYLTENSVVRSGRHIRLPIQRGLFDTVISLNKPVHLVMTDGEKYISGVLEPGDDLKIQWDGLDTKTGVQGVAAEKYDIGTALYNFSKNLLKNRNAYWKARVAAARLDAKPFDVLFDFADSAENALSLPLTRAMPHLSPDAYDILLGSIRAEFLRLRYDITTSVYHQSPEQTLAQHDGELTPRSRLVIRHVLTFDTTLWKSDTYAEMVYMLLFIDYGSRMVTNGNDGHRLADKYHFIDSLVSGRLRTPVLTLFLEGDLEKLNQGEDVLSLVQQSFPAGDSSIYSSYIKARIKGLFMTGTPAPAFELQDSSGKLVHLSDFAGKVVYMDFWFKACVPCQMLFEQMAPVKARFQGNHDVVFLTVSIDDRATWLSAIGDGMIQGFHTYTGGLRTAHPIIRDYRVAHYPTTVLLDRKGRIFLATPSDVPDELAAQINQALQKE